MGPFNGNLRPAAARLVAALAVLALALAGCPRVDHHRAVVNRFSLHGIHHVDEGDLRDHLGTQATERLLGVRLPWQAPSYYDETTFRRDLARIVRYYQAHGYYNAAVQTTRIDPNAAGHEVDIDVALREGPPATVETVWLSGCEPESIRADDRWRVGAATCAAIRSRMQLGLGATFTESAYESDRTLIRDLLKDDGRATARVEARAMVDPITRHVHVVFVLVPGPPSRFGAVELYEGSSGQPVRGRTLPSGYPTRPAVRAIEIRPGDPYSRTALADAQRHLFELGVFGIVRITEDPHVCDRQNRCDDAADPDDPRQWVRVDLKVHVAGVDPLRVRFGVGAELDQLRSDAHLLLNLEHRNFLGGMRRLRIEDRPLLYFPSVITGVGVIEPGNVLLTELRFPELWQGGTPVTSALWDFGPDPFNPGHADRSKETLTFGVEQHFSRWLSGRAYLRTTRIDYYNTDELLDLDPVFHAQYFNQTYTYMEQSLAWDRRDNLLQPRRGTYLSILAQEGIPTPLPESFGFFLRGAIDFRGYLPLGGGFVLAGRGFAGTAIGLSNGLNGWPVPQELRFYSGGANSNRGYPYNSVGYVTTVPLQGCEARPPGSPGAPSAADPLVHYGALDPSGACTARGASPPYDLQRTYPTPHASDPGGTTTPDPTRFANVGGLTAIELSIELRWYLGPFGLVAFFDASDVWGWSPPTGPQCDGGAPPHCVNVTTPPERNLVIDGNTIAPSVPAARSIIQGGIGPLDFHPSAGIGFRYVSPIGVLRLDLGLRLDDLGCTAFNNQIATQDGQSHNQPWYYAVSRPQCNFFGLQIPLNPSIAIGEVY